MGAERLGTYELLERLGAGGMAEVFRARQVAAAGAQRDVVIKRMLPFPDEEREHVEQLFVSEARLSMQLTHGNVVQVFDCGEHGGQYFIVMELVDGLSLADVLKGLRAQGLTVLRAPLAALVVAEVLKGLQYAHTRTAANGEPLSVVHRDVSPDNVLCGSDGQVKLADFGIARASMSGRAKTEPGVFRGKLSYSAPEQLRAEEVDARADVYSTGLVLWRAITGKNPQVDLALKLAMRNESLPAPPREFVDEDLAVILERATAREADARYSTAREFLAQLQAWLNQREIPQRDAAVSQLVAYARSGRTAVDPQFARWVEDVPRPQVERERQLATPAANVETKPHVPVVELPTKVDRPAAPSFSVVPWLIAVAGACVLAAIGWTAWRDWRERDLQDQPVRALAVVEPEKPIPVPQQPSMKKSLALPPPPVLQQPPEPPLPEVVELPAPRLYAAGTPARFTLHSEATSIDVGSSGLPFDAPGEKLLVRCSASGLFFAPALPGPIQVIGEKELKLSSRRGRFFVMGGSEGSKTTTLMMSWVADGRARTSTTERAQLDAAVTSPFFRLDGLDPKVRYRIVQPRSATRPVLVVGEAPHVRNWYSLPDPTFIPARAVPLQAVLTSQDPLDVTGVAGLRFVLLSWPDQPAESVEVTVDVAPRKSRTTRK